jgi:hypothetical protein
MAVRIRIGELVAERRALGAHLPDGTGDWDEPGRWSSGWEVHPWAQEGLDARDDAGYVAEEVPPSFPVGTQAPVSVAMRNAGRTAWRAEDGYALATTSTDWGTGPVAVPDRVAPGGTAQFEFMISARPGQGVHEFQWQMQHADAPFGDASDPVLVTVAAAGEPSECDDIRVEVNRIRTRIRELEHLLQDDPRTDGPILRQIRELKRELDHLITRAQALGCTT